jgi:hypothetical protein
MRYWCLTLFVTFILSHFNLPAQNEFDALRVASRRFDGSASFVGMGGAGGAVGGSFSGGMVNPASFGFFRKDEFTSTFSIHAHRTTASYITDNKINESRTGLNLPNLSLTFANLLYPPGLEPENEIVSYTFGIGINRSNSFYRRSFYSGQNYESSFTDYLAETANGIPVDFVESDEGTLYNMAYWGFLINPSKDFPDFYNSAINSQETDVTQTGTIDARGGIVDYTFSGALNYGHKLYLGGTFLVSSFRYIEENSFREVNNLIYPKQSYLNMEYFQNLRITGLGVGARIGAIFRPVETIRFGASYQTPMRFNLTDRYSFGINSELDPYADVDPDFQPFAPTYSGKSPDYEYGYRVTTPSVTNLSLCIAEPAIGMIAADVEFVNYNSINMFSNEYAFVLENQKIKENFKSSINIRVGGEIVNKEFRYRLGYAHYGSPINQGFYTTPNLLVENFITTGFGIKKPEYYIDVAFSMGLQNDFYVPYVTSGMPFYQSEMRFRNNRFMITIGLPFD